MCHTTSAVVHAGQPGTAAVGSARRAAASRAVDSSCKVARKPSRSITATVAGVAQRSRAGTSAERLGGDDRPIVVDQLVLPRDVVGDVHGSATDGEHREDVAAHRVADHAEAGRVDAEVVEDPLVGRLVLLHDDVDVAEVVGQS